MRRIGRQVWRNAPFSLGVAGFVVLTLQTEFGLGGAWLARVDNDYLYDGILILAALNCFFCGRGRADRTAWIWVGVAISAWAAGDIYYTAVLDGKAVIPFPSLSDAGYLLFYPPVYVGLVVLFHKEVRGIVRSLWLDGLIAALTTAALAASVVYAIVERSLNGSGETSAGVATNLAYPLGDMLVLGIVAGAVALSGWRVSAKWLIFGGGLLVFAVFDSIYLVEIAKNTYVGGTWLDLGWPAGMLLIAGAGTLPSRRVRAAQLDGLRLILVPALFGSIALVLEIVDHFQTLNTLGITLATLALAAVFVRMGMTFIDYLRLLEHTRHESKTDLLTGLWNRRALVGDLDETIEAETKSVLMLFDLNGFKSYNDSFGHPAGDALLARLGERLQSGLPAGGRAYRLGGDEFCVLVRVDDSTMADVIAETTANLTEEGESFKITSSVGIVLLPEEATDTTEALKIVDRRMYRHKGGDGLSARRDAAHCSACSKRVTPFSPRTRTRSCGSPARSRFASPTTSRSRPSCRWHSCTTSASSRSRTRSSSSRARSTKANGRSSGSTRSPASASSGVFPGWTWSRMRFAPHTNAGTASATPTVSPGTTSRCRRGSSRSQTRTRR